MQEAPGKRFKITIDGKTGTGKSTVAGAVAKALKIPQLETGTLYRGITFVLLELDTDLRNEAAVRKAFDGIMASGQFEVDLCDNRLRVRWCGKELTPADLRSERISALSATVSHHPFIRVKMEPYQTVLAKNGAVIEGRDTARVLPDADLKVFLTASTDVCVQRRFDQAKAQHPELSADEIRRELLLRDEKDLKRAYGAPIPGEDSFIIDTSGLSISEVTQRIVDEARRRMTA